MCTFQNIASWPPFYIFNEISRPAGSRQTWLAADTEPSVMGSVAFLT
jgi:hypothetical protein